MAVTIKKIAEVSGVSRGTVDRVLNNRGSVNPQTAERVKKCAEALGYTPNIAGKSLAVRKKGYVIGVLLNAKGNLFFDDILISINRLAKEYEHYGIKVIVKTMKGYDVQNQLKLLQELEPEISGLILTPIDDKEIRQAINQLVDKQIPVVTINTDIQNSKRMCYVGTDYYQGGAIAAGLVTLLKNKGAHIGIVNGSRKLYGHNQRVLGFQEELDKEEYHILDMVESQDDDMIAYEETIKMIKKFPQIDTIFVVASGVYGVCRALRTKKESVTIITFDDIPTTVKLLKENMIKATISQQPKFQGIKAMEIMFEYLVYNQEPLNNEYIIQNQIKIKQNYEK